VIEPTTLQEVTPPRLPENLKPAALK